MWSPTHVQVTIVRAKNLLIKGKNGTNNPFVTIAVGKEKYQTSTKEKEGGEVVTWQEQCELLIPDIGNKACIVLTALHRNNLGIDEFLGTVSIPLSSFDVYERPRSRWYKLEGKPGKEKGKDKERGELEVRIAFTVKASTGSLTDLSKKEKHRTSLGQISKIGGSLMSLGSGEKKMGIKQIAKSIGKKVSRKKRDSNGGDGASESGSRESVGNSPFSSSKSSFGNVDPGVISEDEDEFTFDNLSHKSSGSSLNVNNSALENLAGGEFLRRSTKGPPAKPPRAASSPEKPMDEWEQKLYGKNEGFKRFASEKTKTETPPNSSPVVVSKNLGEEKPSTPEKLEVVSDVKSEIKKSPEGKSSRSSTPSIEISTPSPKPAERKWVPSPSPNLSKSESGDSEMSKFAKKLKQLQPYKKEKKDMDRFIVGEEAINKPEVASKHPKHILDQFKNKSRDDLIDAIIHLQKNLDRSNSQLKELEDYLDQLLLKVMETTPRILQNPYISCKTQANLNYR